MMTKYIIFAFAEIGLGTETDIEQIPDPIPKPNFGAVQKLKSMEPKFIVFDLETTGLSRFFDNFPFIRQNMIADITDN